MDPAISKLWEDDASKRWEKYTIPPILDLLSSLAFVVSEGLQPSLVVALILKVFPFVLVHENKIFRLQKTENNY